MSDYKEIKKVVVYLNTKVYHVMIEPDVKRVTVMGMQLPSTENTSWDIIKNPDEFASVTKEALVVVMCNPLAYN